MMAREDLGLVGRADELAGLTTAARQARAGTGSLMVVRGESGAGKTRMLDELAAAAGPAARGVAHRSEAGVPFRVVSVAFGCTPDAEDPRRASIGQRLRARDDEGRWVPFEEVPELRADALDLLVEIIEEDTRTDTHLLLLDDLQWADLGSMATIDAVARRLDDLPLLVVLAHQQGVTDVAVADSLTSLTAAANGVVDLGPLDEDAMAALARNRFGRPPTARLRRALATTGGNPLLALELLDTLETSGALATTDGTVDLAHDRWPTPSEDLLLGRLSGLGATATEIVTLAAVLGSRCTLPELEAVSGRPASEVLAAIGAARAHGLLEDAGDAVAFRHDLVRDAVAGQLSTAERVAVHAAAARALAATGAPPERVAHHLVVAPDGTLEDQAGWLLRAARRLRSNPQTAIGFAQRALELHVLDEDMRLALTVELATAHCWAGQPQPAVRLARAELARRHDEHATVPVLRRLLARALTLEGRAAEAAAALDPSEAPAGDPGERTALRVDAAFARLIALDVHGATAGVEALADRRSEPVVACACATIESWYATMKGQAREAVDAGLVAVDAADLDPAGNRYRPWLVLAQAQLVADDPAAAAESLRHDRAASADHGALWGTPVHHSVVAGTHLRAGRWDDCVAEAAAGIRWAADHRTRLGAPWMHAYLAQVALRRGDTAAAQRHLADAEAELAGGARMGLDGVWWTRAVMAEQQGDLDAAKDSLAGLWALLTGMGYLARCPLVGPDLVRVAVLCGDRTTATTTAEELAQVAHDTGTTGADAAARRTRGLVTGDVEVIDNAVALYHSVASPVEATWAAAEATLVAARENHADAARRARDVLAEQQSRGATGEMEVLIERLRAEGVRVRRRRRASAPTVGWDALTDTEWAVTRCIAEGLSNREVGARLYISPRTVESHLTNIFRKVGLTSRVELAVAVAAR